MRARPPQWFSALILWLSILGAASAAPAGQPVQATTPHVTGVLISGATGAPLEGATIGLCVYLDSDAERERQAAGRFLPEPIRTTTTDASGRFAMPVSATGPIYLIARAGGHAGSFISRPPAGADADLGVIRLPVGRRLAGVVVGPDDAPVAKARVLSMAGEADSARNYKPLPLIGEAVSDEKGRFAIEDIGLQKVPILVMSDGMALRPKEIEHEGENLVVHLQRAVTVSGRVVAPDGASPVAGAWVVAKDGTLELVARSGAEGRFELGRLGPEEELHISARAPLTAPEAIAFHAPSPEKEVRAAATPPLTLQLLPGARLRVRVIDETTRTPVHLARVHLSHSGGSDTALTDPAGEAVLAGAAPGKLYVYLNSEGYGRASFYDLVLTQGEDRQMSISLKKTATIKGRVISFKDKQPVEGVVLLAGTMYSPPLVSKIDETMDLEGMRSAADGTFLLQGIPAGEKILLEAREAGYARSRLEIAPLSPGERREGAEIVLEQGHPIIGVVLDPDGAPVTRAHVVAIEAEGGEFAERLSLRNTSYKSSQDQVGDPALPEADTDDKGRFSIPEAGAGRWSIAVRADGFASKLVRRIIVEAPSGANTGEIVLERSVRLRGRVVDGEGKPVSPASLYLKDAAEGISIDDIKTNEDGTFESGDLPSGQTFDLSVRADGYVELELNGLTPPIQDLLVTLSRGAPLAGQVLDARTGAPISEYRVHVLYPKTGESRKPTFDWGDSESVRSETGRFSLPNVRPGRVRLEVTAPGRVDGIVDDVEVRADGSQDEVTIRLESSVMLNGVVVDDEGHPLSDVEVERELGAVSGLNFAQVFGDDTKAESTRTDVDGAFRLELRSAEPLRLSFEHDAFLSAELAVDPAVRRDGLKVTMRRGAVLTGLVVKEPDKAPVRGARVTAMRSGTGFLASNGRAETEPDGSFRIEGLRPGTYEVYASAEGLRASREETVLVKEGSSVASITLTLAGGTQLNGTITGLGPAELAGLTVSTGGGRDAATVDKEGKFQVDGLAPGTNVLSIGWPGTNQQSVTKVVEIPEGVSTWQETIELGSGLVVSGTVSRGTKPLAGATVNFTDRGAGFSVRAESGSEGEYIVRDLRPGTYTVGVFHKESLQARAMGSLTVEEDRRFDIALPAGQITGKVLSAESGRAIAGATVSIEPATAASTVEEQASYLLMGSTVDEEGHYVISGVSEGVYRLTASAAGHGYESREVAVSGDSLEAVTSFSLSPATPLPVRVLLTATGEPAVGGIFVMGLIAGRRDPLGASGSGDKVVYQGTSIPDESGRFQLESLKPGSYDIVLWIPGLAPEIIHDVVVPSAGISASLEPGVTLMLNGKGIPDGTPGRAVLMDPQGRPAYQQAFLAEAGFALEKGMESVIGIVKPGTYILRGRLPDGRSVEKTVTVLPGEKAEIVIP